MDQQHIDTAIAALEANIDVDLMNYRSPRPALISERLFRNQAALQAFQALRAQAQPPQQPQYVPVEDGFGYECQCSDCVDDEGDESLWRQKIYISGREVGICYVDESDDGHHVYLPDNVRLCRLAAPQQEGNNDTGTD
jgi:hypothetical protein